MIALFQDDQAELQTHLAHTHQPFSHPPLIRQSKQGCVLSDVFRQTTKAHFPIAKMALDYAKRGSTLARPQLIDLCHVRHIRRRTHQGMNQTRLSVDANMRFHAKKLLIPFLGLVHFTVAFAVLVLGLTRRVNDRRIDHRALAQHQTTVSSTSAAKPSVDFRKSTDLGYRYTFSTLASARIMASWLLRESEAQHPGLAKRFENRDYGALTVELPTGNEGLTWRWVCFMDRIQSNGMAERFVEDDQA